MKWFEMNWVKSKPFWQTKQTQLKQWTNNDSKQKRQALENT